MASKNWIAPAAEWRFERARSYEDIARILGVRPGLLVIAYLKMVNYFGSRYDNRIRYAKRALQLKPHDPLVLRHLAWSYWLVGNQKTALEIYRRLEKIDPKSLDKVFSYQSEIKKAYVKGLL